MQNDSGLVERSFVEVPGCKAYDFITNLELIWLVMLQERKKHRWLRAPARLLTD